MSCKQLVSASHMVRTRSNSRAPPGVAQKKKGQVETCIGLERNHQGISAGSYSQQQLPEDFQSPQCASRAPSPLRVPDHLCSQPLQTQPTHRTLASSALSSSSSASVRPSTTGLWAAVAPSTGTSVMESENKPLLGEFKLMSARDKRNTTVNKEEKRNWTQVWDKGWAQVR